MVAAMTTTMITTTIIIVIIEPAMRGEITRLLDSIAVSLFQITVRRESLSRKYW